MKYVNLFLPVLSNAACPALKRIPNVLIIHGEGDGVMEHMKVKILSYENLMSLELLLDEIFDFIIVFLYREASPQIGFCTNLLYQLHMEHIIQKP